MILLRWFAVACALCAGCVLSNMTPQSRFQDSAYVVNDAARWGAVDAALRYVAPDYARPFTLRHREWGRQFSIGEIDMVRLTLDKGRKSATSQVEVSWYDTHGMSLRSSVIEQKWQTTRGGDFQLVSEAIVSGDPTLFAQVEDASKTQGGPGADASPGVNPGDPAATP
jgi:hypothetical protein